MTAAPSYYLPNELIYLMESLSELPASEVAAHALPILERLSDSQQKADIGFRLLEGIGRRQGCESAEALKALEVMERFPHYPRPRAAVAVAALRSLAAPKAA